MPWPRRPRSASTIVATSRSPRGPQNGLRSLGDLDQLSEMLVRERDPGGDHRRSRLPPGARRWISSTSAISGA